MKKAKILSLLLCVFMLISLFPTAALAVEETGDNNDTEVTTPDNPGGDNQDNNGDEEEPPVKPDNPGDGSDNDNNQESGDNTDDGNEGDDNPPPISDDQQHTEPLKYELKGGTRVVNDGNMSKRIFPAGCELEILVKPSTEEWAFSYIAATNPRNWTLTLDGKRVDISSISLNASPQNGTPYGLYIDYTIPVDMEVKDYTLELTPESVVFATPPADLDTSKIKFTESEVPIRELMPAIKQLQGPETIDIGQSFLQIMVRASASSFDPEKAVDINNWNISGDSGLTLANVNSINEYAATLIFTGKAVSGKSLIIAAKPAAFGGNSESYNYKESDIVKIDVSENSVTPKITTGSRFLIGQATSYITLSCSNVKFGEGAENLSNWTFTGLDNISATPASISSISYPDGTLRNNVRIEFRSTGGFTEGTIKIQAKPGAFESAPTGGSNELEVSAVNTGVQTFSNISYTYGSDGNPTAVNWTVSSEFAEANTIRYVEVCRTDNPHYSQVYYETPGTNSLKSTPGQNGAINCTYTLDPECWTPEKLPDAPFCISVYYQNNSFGGELWTVKDGKGNGGDYNYPDTPDTPVTPSTGTGSGGSGSRPSGTVTSPDGTTTTTTTNNQGTVTTTTRPDGSQTVVETKRDGTVTSTTTDKDGNKSETVKNKDGSRVTTVERVDGCSATVTSDKDGKINADVKLSSSVVSDAQNKGDAVALPIQNIIPTSSRASAPTITVNTGSAEPVKVIIPSDNLRPGVVAVIVKADDTEEIVKTSVPTEKGLSVPLPNGATVKLIDNSKSFGDVPSSHWAKDTVNFAAARELFSGTGENTFSPEEPMTRAMLVTVLARFDGQDTDGGNTWYENGMNWAVANGISDGSNPNGNITREQLAVMLWRYSGSPASSGGLDKFPDAGQVSDYAQDAMRWAVENGIISGYGSGELGAQGQATRSQVAQMLKNFITK